MTPGLNRITLGIDKVNKTIADKALTPEKLAALSKTLDMEIGEYCRFQELKSAAMGTSLTAEEAQTVYGYLGTTPDHFNRQPVAAKYVLTTLFQNLLDERIAAKAPACSC